MINYDAIRASKEAHFTLPLLFDIFCDCEKCHISISQKIIQQLMIKSSRIGRRKYYESI